MKAVTRLILTYFTGPLLSRGMTGIGLALLLAGIACLLYLPPLQGSIGSYSKFSLAEEGVFLSLPIFGMLAFFCGSALMPLMFAGFARGRLLYVLPFGRIKVLASAVITVALVSVVAGFAVVVYYIGLPIDPRLVFSRAVTTTFLTFSVMYLILWWVSRTRSTVGLLGGAMLAIATLSLPVNFIVNPSASLRGPLIACLVLWGALAVGFLLMPRLKIVASMVRLRATERVVHPQATKPYPSGREIELLIGIGKPWMLALGQIFPILIATFFISRLNVWLFYFALFSAVSGAISSSAAIRSRSLWLRTQWSRVELFTAVESAFWRHNGYALGVLLLLFVAIGTHLGFQPSLLAFGLTLLVLSTIASTYLGLMMTRDIGWRESCLVIFTMLFLMGIAVDAAKDPIDTASVAAPELTLAALALGFRYTAKRRWIGIDWAMRRTGTEPE